MSLCARLGRMAPLFCLCFLITFSGPIRAQEIDPERLLQSAERVLETVSEIRGLDSIRPIKKGVKSREEIRSFFVERIDEEFSHDEIEAEEKFLQLLGLIPADLDLYSFMVDLLTEQIAGFYDPDSDTLYIADWIPPEQQEPVLAHELTHALQDQQIDLEDYLRGGDEVGDDQLLARTAVIEGEGLLVMLEFAMRPFGRNVLEIPNLIEMNRSQTQVAMEAGEFPLLRKAPAYIRESLLFPYTYGGAFLQTFVRERCWQEINALYQDLPTSTEQILHPERFLDRDDPLDLSGDRFIQEREGEERIYETELGEFSILLLLDHYLETEAAEIASRGWDGDGFALFQTADGHRLSAVSSWDSAADAREFFDAVRELVKLRFPEVEKEIADENRIRIRSRRARIAVSLHDTRVEWSERHF